MKFKYSFIFLVTSVILKGFTFLFFMWLAKVLEIDDYSKFGIFYAMFTILTSIGHAGIVEISVNEIKVGVSKKNEIMQNATISFLQITSIIILTFLLIYAFNPYSLVNFIIVTAGFFASFALLKGQLLRLFEDHFSSLYYSFLIPLLSLIVGILSFYYFKNIASLFAGMAAGGALTVFSIFGSFKNTKISRNPNETAQKIKLLFPYLVIYLIGWLNGYGNNFFIDIVLSEKQVAVWTLCLSISGIPQVIATSLNQVWNPSFYNNYEKITKEELNLKSIKYYIFLSSVLFLSGILASLIIPYIFSIVGGNLINYVNLKVEIMMIFISFIFITPFWHSQNYFMLEGAGFRLMRNQILSGSIGFLIWLLSMLNFGTLGIFIGLLANNLIRSIFMIVESHYTWGAFSISLKK
tara:strand:+ start:8372 stop:9595 length:1224 start_codon:yes stop_codon:yes gene_type:complete